jgi:Fe2+ or Zn2+ uptake regulation protein
VLQVMAAQDPQRLNSEEIFREMRRRGMRTSLSTVYRIAQKLYAVGMLLREMDDTGKVHYRLQKANAGTQGVRLICRRSGHSVMLEDAQLHAGLIAAAAREGLNVSGQTLVLEVHTL